MSNENFTKKMIELGKKTQNKNKSSSNNIEIKNNPNNFEDPYLISPHGNIYSTARVIKEHYEEDEYIGYELI